MIQAQTQRYTYLKFVLTILSIAVGAGIAHYVMRSPSSSSIISNYQEKRDLAELVQLFENNWWWLTTRPYESGYAEFIFQKKSPNDYDSRYFGKLNIDVARDNNKLAGFVAYYVHTNGEGQLLFLAVDPEFRGKQSPEGLRYGELLLKHGLVQLQKLGAKRVWLLTRVENVAAQKLYRRAGLIETSRDEGFVYFDLIK